MGYKGAAARNQSREEQQSDHQMTSPDSGDNSVEMARQRAFGESGLELVLQSKAMARVLQQGATVTFKMATPFQIMLKSRGAKDAGQVEHPNRFTRSWAPRRALELLKVVGGVLCSRM